MDELDGFMRRIKKVDEFVELFFTMGAISKDIIYVTPPYEGFKRNWANIFCSKSSMKRLAIGRCHFCAHCCAVQL